MISKSNLSLLNPLNSLLNLSIRKKRILFLTFFIITFLLSSTIADVPGSKASESQDKFKLTSDQSLDQSMQLPGKTEGLYKIKEGNLNGQERELGFQPSQLNVELMGMWPYGGCFASAVDTNRNIALIGNGYTLQVLDISTPSSLSRIGEVTLRGNAADIAIAGNYAYVVTNSHLQIIDISDLSSPFRAVSVYFEMGILRSVVFSSGYVYVAASHYGGLYIFDVSNPNDPILRVWYPGHINHVAIWENYAIFDYQVQVLDTDSQEWVDTDQVQVIDVSTPSNPSSAGNLTAEVGYDVRGIDVSDDGYVYTCQYSETDKSSKIAVIDVRTPTDHEEVGSYVASGRWFAGIKVSGDYAYIYEHWGSVITMDISIPSSPSFAGEYDVPEGNYDLDVSGSLAGVSRGNSFALLDVSNPSNPSQLGQFYTPGGVGGGNSIAVSGNYAYVACSRGGMRIISVSDPSSPFVIGVCYDFDARGGLAVSGRYAYCLSFPRLEIVDISTPQQPFLLTVFDLAEDTSADFESCYIAVRGNYAYVLGNRWLSDEWAGWFLAVVDISDPQNPSITGLFENPVIARCGGLALSGNYVYISLEDSPYVDVRRGSLKVMDISDPANPREVGEYFSGEEYTATTDSEGKYSHTVSYWWSGTAIPSKDGYAFSPSYRTYVDVDSDQIDQDYTATAASTNVLPQLTSFTNQSTNIATQETNANGNILYQATQIISGTVKNEQGIGIEGVTITFADASSDLFRGVAVRGDYAYLAGGYFRVIDISDPRNPSEIYCSDELDSHHVALSGDYAYLTGGRLKVIDISDPYNPNYVGNYIGEGDEASLAASGNYAYLPGSLSIFKNVLAPEVSITTPSALSTLHGSVSVEVQASHSSGIDKVEFYIDDSYKAADNTSPYTYTWDTTSEAETSYRIRARAYNNDGKSSDSEIEVTVRNQKPLELDHFFFFWRDH
jgi:hypothetical protein